MPTTITAQNGKVIKQNTKIAVGDCPITVLSHRMRGHKAIIAVEGLLGGARERQRQRPQDASTSAPAKPRP